MLSIVIPAYNEASGISKTLDSILAQQYTENFEVIVVDNNSTDTTAAIAKSYADRLNLKVLHEPQVGRGAARAAGFAAASGSIICSTDADTIVPSDWLIKITEPLSGPGIVAVAGTSKITEGTPLQNTIFNWLQPTLGHLFEFFHGYIWLTGCNASVRKDAYIKTGGFNRDLNALEDADMGRCLSNIGRIRHITYVPVTSSARRFKGGFVKGLLHYVKPYLHMYLLKKDRIHLHDVR